MVDDDLKKILSDLKMDDLVKELEEPSKSRFTFRHVVISTVALLSLGLCTFAFMYKPTAEPQPQAELIADADAEEDADEAGEDGDSENGDIQESQEQDEESDYDYENPFKAREEVAATWAAKMVQLEPAMKGEVHELWDLLRQRKDDLELSATELSNILFDNARRRQDFYSKEAEVLLSRYQAVDARHSVKVANCINSIYVIIQKKHDPELNQAYAEMLGELGAESYSTHQVQISKELILQEMKYNIALQTVIESQTLKELQDNLQKAKARLAEFATNGVMQTFSQVEVYQKQLAPSVKAGLDAIFYVSPKEGMFDPQEAAILQELLQVMNASENEQTKYFEQFQRYVKKRDETRSSVYPQSSVALN